MKNKMRALVILVLLRGGFLFADDSLKATATHRFWRGAINQSDDNPPKILSGNTGIFSVILLLKNTGHSTIRVPTKYLDGFLLSTSDCLTLRLLIRSMKLNDGTVPVVSDADLSIVELGLGEVAMISYGEELEKLPNKPIRVQFTVDEDIAKRYRLWSGTIEVVSKPDNEEPLPPKAKKQATTEKSNPLPQPPSGAVH